MHLRTWQSKDAATLLNLYRQVDDLGRQLPELETLEDAERYIQEWLLPSSDRFVFAIDNRGEAAGLVAVNCAARDDTGRWDRGWVYYWAAPAIRGTGAMKASVRAICDWALGELGKMPGVELVGAHLDLSLLAHSPQPNLRRLELGYRSNNPASGAVAAAAGFTVEGIEREKFLYGGQTFDAITAARLRGAGATPLTTLHHIELWTSDFASALPCWDWLLTSLGMTDGGHWQGGKSWLAPDGSYLVLEESPDVSGRQEHTRAGLNHLALNCGDRNQLERLKARAPEHGWCELFAENYPHAGGPEHTALYLENSEGFEIEVVAP